MRLWLGMLSVAVVALLAVAWAYDRTAEDRLPRGVTVAGLDVGGLTTERARVRLRARLLGPLNRTVVVRSGQRTFRLPAGDARVSVNLERMLHDARRASRAGSFLTRSWRRISGGAVDVDVPPRVTFDRQAVDRYVERIHRAVDRPARDAKVVFSAARLSVREGRSGLRLHQQRLRSAVQRALISATAHARIEAHVERVQPKVTAKDVAERHRLVITIDRPNFRLRVFRRLRLVKTYPIAVGKVGLETPRGLYHVHNKAVDPDWYVPNKKWAGDLAGKVIPGGTAQNPIKARWLGLVDGVGIHGTDDEASIGSRASHGCIRMRIRDVKRLYEITGVGTPVFIA